MINTKRFFFVLFLASTCAFFSFAQTTPKKNSTGTELNSPSGQTIKATAAYAEVLLRKTELTAELESLLVNYTEEYPKVKELHFQLNLLQKEMARLLALNASESSKLSMALGKLLVRKTELETDLWSLQKQYNNEHPDVKRAKRRVEIFDQAIKEILP
jgi:peptidoglycan hydrolase CwlO-like protein